MFSGSNVGVTSLDARKAHEFALTPRIVLQYFAAGLGYAVTTKLKDMSGRCNVIISDVSISLGVDSRSTLDETESPAGAC